MADQAASAYAQLTSKRHFCRKEKCDGSCFNLDALTAPPEPPAPSDKPEDTDALPLEPPLKRRKGGHEETPQPENTEGGAKPGSTREGSSSRPGVMTSMGHLVVDVTRMAAFSTAGYVLSGPLGATVAFSVASAKSLRNP